MNGEVDVISNRMDAGVNVISNRKNSGVDVINKLSGRFYTLRYVYVSNIVTYIECDRTSLGW